jgi:hypothetical protein
MLPKEDIDEVEKLAREPEAIDELRLLRMNSPRL